MDRNPEQIIESFGISSPDQIDIEAIAFALGAVVQYEPLKGCSARIVGSGDRALITVDSKSTRTRQRFSIAHELYHWLQDRGNTYMSCTPVDDREADDTKTRETLADKFAARLLMPTYLFQPRVQRSKVSFKSIDALAAEFGTSIIATAIRFVDCCSRNCVLCCYNQSGRRWFHRGTQVDDSLWPAKEPHHDSLSFECAYTSVARFPSRIVDGQQVFENRGMAGVRVTEEPRVMSDKTVLTLYSW